MLGEIPIDNTYAASVQTIDLDGQKYRMRFNWDSRTQNWYSSIGTLDTWLVQGYKVTAGAALFLNLPNSLMPDGSFWVLDKRQDKGPEIAYSDLGDSVSVVYVSPIDGFDITDPEPEVDSL